MEVFFTFTQAIILVKLLLAHFLTDFVLQPDSWIEEKHAKSYKSVRLYLHSFIAGLISYLLLANWGSFGLPLLIAVSHATIDIAKVSYFKKRKVIGFILDQLAHILIIIILWVSFFSSWAKVWELFVWYFGNYRLMIITLAYLSILWPSGKLIEVLTKRWRKECEGKGKSLTNVGKYIGFFERVLILTFILLHSFEMIGFLIAAKSLLRFREEERKQTEYILIGSLLSFTVAILTGLFLLKIY